MGIASLVAWLWMAAQSGTHYTYCCEAPEAENGLYHAQLSAPEHVIEIRTKRCSPKAYLQMAETCDVARKTGQTPLPVECEKLWDRGDKDENCIRSQLREIWIDGVKFGVLRETGDK